MLKTFRLLLMVPALLLGGAPPALAVTPTDVVIEDRAGVLDRNTLVPAIAEIEFHEPARVAVYTNHGSGGPPNSQTGRSHRRLPWTGCAMPGATCQFSSRTTQKQ